MNELEEKSTSLQPPIIVPTKKMSERSSQSARLDELVMTSLCQDINFSGKTHADFNLAAHIEIRADTFRAPNSKKRGAVQKKFCALKKHTPEANLKFLQKNDIAAGEGLKGELLGKVTTTKAAG